MAVLYSAHPITLRRRRRWQHRTQRTRLPSDADADGSIVLSALDYPQTQMTTANYHQSSRDRWGGGSGCFVVGEKKKRKLARLSMSVIGETVRFFIHCQVRRVLTESSHECNPGVSCEVGKKFWLEGWKVLRYVECIMQVGDQYRQSLTFTDFLRTLTTILQCCCYRLRLCAVLSSEYAVITVGFWDNRVIGCVDCNAVFGVSLCFLVCWVQYCFAVGFGGFRIFASFDLIRN